MNLLKAWKLREMFKFDKNKISRKIRIKFHLFIFIVNFKIATEILLHFNKRKFRLFFVKSKKNSPQTCLALILLF